jgi:hypothetical protein
MNAPITLPQNNVVAGQAGHLSDHDDISSALGTLWGWAAQGAVNVAAPPYSADPTGTTDSTGAIGTAIAAAEAQGGGDVYFPPGTYKISAQLTTSSYVRLVGAGSGVAAISQTSTTANGIGAVDTTKVSIVGLSINGPGSGSGVGINLSLSVDNDSTYVHLVDVQVASFGSHGIEIQSSETCHFDRVNVSGNGADGFHIYGTGTSCKWDACYALNNTAGIGYHLIGLSYSELSACAADSNSSGYSLSGCTSVKLSACGAESNSSNGYTFSGGANNKLDGCFVYANNNYGVHVTSSETNTRIDGFKENSPTGSAVNSILVDAGCSATVVNSSVVTPVSYLGSVTRITPFGVTGRVWAPEDNNLILANYDPITSQGSAANTAGTLYLMKLVAWHDLTITDLWLSISNGGTGASTGSYVGLYSSSGTLLSGSADIASFITVSGASTPSIPLTTPQAISAGSFVWAALLTNLASTQPSLHNANSTALQGNPGLTAATYRFATNGTGRTTLPSSITPSSNAQTSALSIWVGAS